MSCGGLPLAFSCLVLCASWTWMSISISRLGKFFAIVSSSKFSVSIFWNYYNANVFSLDVNQDIPYPNLIFFSSCCWAQVLIQSFRSLIHSLSSDLFPSSISFILVIFQIGLFFFIYSRSLLKHSLNSSTLLSSPVSTFMINTLNSLSGRLLICFILFLRFLFLLEPIPLFSHFA